MPIFRATNPTPIIGISGRMRAGKDTVAKILIKQGFTKVAFADPLREALEALDPWIIPNHEEREYPGSGMGGAFLSTLRATHSWEDLKNSPWSDEVRRLMQRFGTEVGRDTFDPGFWVDRWASAISKLDTLRVVSPDTRFSNEADAIKRRGGFVLEVQRPDLARGVNSEHVSETNLPEPTHVIVNDGTLADLERKTLDFLAEVGLYSE